VIAFFIILTTAVTIHAAGSGHEIRTAADATSLELSRDTH